MIRALVCFCLAAVAVAADSVKTVTWTGWFSDANCAAPRVKSGIIGPNNPECATTCIRKGVAAVFVSEQARALYTVKGQTDVIDDLIYHVEVQARVDEEAKTIEIQKVNRLEVIALSCVRPKAAKK